MIGITSGRRGGKTYELMQWLKENEGGRQVIVHSAQYAKHLREEYDISEDSLARPQKILSYQQVIHGANKGKPLREIAVDNVDLLLDDILGQTPVVVTFTGYSTTPVALKSNRDSVGS